MADKIETKMMPRGSVYIQYGCGLSAPEGWMNFDSSLRLRLERIPPASVVIRAVWGRLFPQNVRYGNIIHGLPVPDGCAKGVYASHVLEHIARDDLHRALENTFRVLSPGGVFRLVVPDLGWRVAVYAKSATHGDHHAADEFLESCMLGLRNHPKTLSEIARSQFGNSAHLWMYDYAGLELALQSAGFESVRRCEFGDAQESEFAVVEERGRFFDGGHKELAIEARRPAGPNT